MSPGPKEALGPIGPALEVPPPPDPPAVDPPPVVWVAVDPVTVARELGVSRQTIVNIERGVSEPRVLLALALAAVLGVTVQELFRKRPVP
jgi:hypothetical protein